VSDGVLRGVFCLLGVTQDQSVAGYGCESLVAGFSQMYHVQVTSSGLPMPVGAGEKGGR
jgi:hypothetical protein